jgi:hypothetical protein
MTAVRLRVYLFALLVAIVQKSANYPDVKEVQCTAITDAANQHLCEKLVSGPSIQVYRTSVHHYSDLMS